MNPEPSPSNVLELEDVDVPAPADPDAIVVRSLSWRVAPGDRWLVLGASGSGKTSVLHVAAGLMRPVRGRHRLFGEDLAQLRESERESRRARVGVVFGGGGRLFTQLTVAENLALPLFYHGRDRRGEGLQRIAVVLEALSLEPLADRFPRELPRRLSQRVALARALVLAPEVLLVDDVTAGLSSADVEWWRRFLGECAAGRCAIAPSLRTVVLAAVEDGHWADFADRVAVVEGGTWRAEGSARDAGRGVASGGG